MTQTDTIYVIMKSTGEYSDRMEYPIRYVLTEKDAIEAVALTAIEAQRQEVPPFPETACPYGFFDAHGNLVKSDFYYNNRTHEWKKKTNYDALVAAEEKAYMEYYAACLALGHVDPKGSDLYATYSYVAVTIWRDTA